MNQQGCFIVILSVLIFAACIALLMREASLPVVHVSNSTGQCVRVLSDDDYDCENLPEFYSRTWVQ